MQTFAHFMQFSGFVQRKGLVGLVEVIEYRILTQYPTPLSRNRNNVTPIRASQYTSRSRARRLRPGDALGSAMSNPGTEVHVIGRLARIGPFLTLGIPRILFFISLLFSWPQPSRH